jgi:hypothetical protein
MQEFFVFQINELNNNCNQNSNSLKNLIKMKAFSHNLFSFFKIKQPHDIPDTNKPICPKGTFLVAKQTQNQ